MVNKAELVEFAKRIEARAPRCTTEEATKISLILPFIALLGYDDRDPEEVCPEHCCDFSEKYRNKVDFAIMKDQTPIIAIECKTPGAVLRDDRGQLRSYFNAASTVKMGVLTDGLIWEFYADSDSPNMMDEKAFLEIDLRQIARGNVEDSAFEAIQGMKKGSFDPENIGAEAKRKLIFRSILHQINVMARDPQDDLARLLLSGAGMKRVSQRMVDDYRPTIVQAFKEYINEQILARLDLPKKEERPAVSVPQAAIPVPAVDDGIVTTEAELEVYNWTLRRLAFLVKDEALFREIDRVEFRDFKSNFAVFYKQERLGRIFTFNEAKRSPIHRFEFPGGVSVHTDELTEIDEPLLAAFHNAVKAVTRAG